MVKLNQISVDSDLNRHHSKYEDPLWDNDEPAGGKSVNIVLKNFKHGSKKDYSWDFFDSGKYLFSLRAYLLNFKQIEFLQSPEGMLFLLNKYKEGYTNASRIISQIKHETSNRKR